MQCYPRALQTAPDLFDGSPELLQSIFPPHPLLFQGLACPLLLGHLFFQVLEQTTGTQ